jgi:hypothetical protein
MNLGELVLLNLPLLLVLAFAVVLVRKTGAFEQRAHRQRVEALLERIAVAVERRTVER